MVIKHFLFQTILNRKHVRQMFAFLDSAISFNWRHIFISLSSFIGITNSIIILYKTSLVTESEAFWSLKIADALPHCIAIFLSIWSMHNFHFTFTDVSDQCTTFTSLLRIIYACICRIRLTTNSLYNTLKSSKISKGTSSATPNLKEMRSSENTYNYTMTLHKMQWQWARNGAAIYTNYAGNKREQCNSNWGTPVTAAIFGYSS